jgi:hypothetical protein
VGERPTLKRLRGGSAADAIQRAGGPLVAHAIDVATAERPRYGAGFAVA